MDGARYVEFEANDTANGLQSFGPFDCREANVSTLRVDEGEGIVMPILRIDVAVQMRHAEAHHQVRQLHRVEQLSDSAPSGSNVIDEAVAFGR